MRLLMSVTSALVLAAVVGGCSDSTSPQSVAGIWRETNGPPGSLLEITVILNGSDVSGFGAWCNQGGGCGVTTETGTVKTSGIEIVTNFDDGRVQTFNGALVSDSSLVGTMSNTPPDAQLQLLASQSFTRVVRDPPN